jgi:hypothetical protein
MATGLAIFAGIQTAVWQKAVTADYTLTAAEAVMTTWELTGSLGGVAKTLTLPGAYPGMLWVVRNDTGASVTVKVTGGTGVPVATGKAAILRGTSSDVARVTADA